MSDTQGIDAGLSDVEQRDRDRANDLEQKLGTLAEDYKNSPAYGNAEGLVAYSKACNKLAAWLFACHRLAAPPDPRKDLAALEELVEECGLSLASGEIRCNFKHVETFDRLNKLRERLAEMRGAKRGSDVKDNPIKWNPYNKVVQDHRDGTIDHEATNRERAKRGLPVPWKPEMGDKEVRERPVE